MAAGAGGVAAAGGGRRLRGPAVVRAAGRPPGRRAQPVRRRVAHLAGLFDAYATHRPELLDAWRAGDDADVRRRTCAGRRSCGGACARGSARRTRPSGWPRPSPRSSTTPALRRPAGAAVAVRPDPAARRPPRRARRAGRHRDVHLWLPHPSPALWDRVAAARRRAGVPAAPRRPHRRRCRATRCSPRSAATSASCSCGWPAARRRRPPPRRRRTTAGDAARPPAARPARRPAPLRGDHVARRRRPDRAGARLPRPAPAGRGAARGRARAARGRPDAGAARHPRRLPGRRDVRAAGLGRVRARADDGGRAAHPGHRLARPAGRPGAAAGQPAARRRRPRCSSSPTPGSPRRRCSTCSPRARSAAGSRLDDDDVARLRDLVARAGVRWGLDAAHRRPYRLDDVPAEHLGGGAGPAAARGGDGGRQPGWARRCRSTTWSPATSTGSGGSPSSSTGSPRRSTALTGAQPLAAWVAALTEALDALTATTAADAWQAGQARAELADAARAAGPHAADVPLALADVRGAARRAAARAAGPGQLPHRHAHRVHAGPDALGAAPGGLPARPGRRRVPARRRGRRRRRARPRPARRRARPAQRGPAAAAGRRAAPRRSTSSSSTRRRRADRRPPPAGGAAGRAARRRRPPPPARDGARAASSSAIRCSPSTPATSPPARSARPGPFSFDRVELAGARAAAGAQAPPAAVPARARCPRRRRDDRRARRPRARSSSTRSSSSCASGSGLPISAGDDDAARRAARRAGRAAALGGRRPAAARPAGRGATSTRCRAAEWRRGELPPGALGRACSPRCSTTSRSWSRRARGSPARTPEVARRRRRAARTAPACVGTVGGVHGDAAVRVEFSKLGAKQRVRAWVRLVALTAAQPGPRLAGGDGRPRGPRRGRGRAASGRSTADRARGVLADLVALHREGLRAPLPLPTKRRATPTPARAPAAATRGRRAGRGAARLVRGPVPRARRGALRPRCSAPRPGAEVLRRGTGDEPTGSATSPCGCGARCSTPRCLR